MQKAEVQKKLDSAVEYFKSDIAQVRTGRANPTLIEELVVEAYGSPMKVKELGTISVPEPQMIVVSPWDKSVLSAIDKAIRNSELKLNPVTADGILRIPIPPLSQERREEFAKLVNSKTEQAKQSVRNIRQDALKAIDKLFADKLIGEDEKFTRKEEIEKMVKDITNEITEMGEQKRDQIMEIA
jgi:ribosome recycling factor